MATITEDYVSFETAKLLKEKGFDEDCHAHWDLTTKTKTPKIGLSVSSKNWNYKWNPIQFPISAPTHQMAMKWLREVYYIYADPIKQGNYNDCSEYYTWIVARMGIIHRNPSVADKLSYEEAAEAALKYSLKNLI